jgi:pSer/pThr/pTyr-binding forkhead associated (FHA) protein
MNATSYELFVKHGPVPGLIYPLTDKGLTIGRDPLSDILINDPEVSRQHALLSRTPTGEYRLQDLGSTNGTYVDGKRLEREPITLKSLNTITMGGTVTLIFRERAESRKLPDRGFSPGEVRRKTSSFQADENRAKASSVPAKQEGSRSESSYEGQPLIYSAGSEIPKTTQIETGSYRDLSPNLILGLVLLLLCSCACILVFLFYLGGDWFFREIGLVP